MSKRPAPQMLKYWEDRATSADDPWLPIYEGVLDLSNYNFVTRRDTVMRLLQGYGEFPRVLDVGCGTGDYGELSVRHKGEYHCLDFSHGMIAQARRRNKDVADVSRFICGSGEALPYADDTFDLAIGIGYIEYFSDPSVPLAELARVVRPGGLCIIQSFKPELMGRIYGFVAHPLSSIIGSRQRAGLVPKPGEWVDTQYDQGQMDGLMSTAGFGRIDCTFNHFYVFPGPLRRRFPTLHIKVSEALGLNFPGLFRSMAVNYFGMYRKGSSSGESSGRG